MAPVLHKDITDPDIHELKGIDFAPKNSIYVANDRGSGSWTVLPDLRPELIGVPVGSISYYPGLIAPSKWFVCDGAAVSRATYSSLFEVIGTTYGEGDGSTTFNLPNAQENIIAGNGLMGGVSANRLTGRPGGINGNILGAKGGERDHTLLSTEVPAFSGTTSEGGAHSHPSQSGVLRRTGSLTVATTGSKNMTSKSVGETNEAGAHFHTITVNSGGGGAHSNLQPYIVLNTIIYHGVA